MPVSFASAANSILSKPVRFFISPDAAGRRIVCGFSYIQRIRYSGAIDVWFPEVQKKNIASRVMAGDASVLDDFHIEWAAARQFELLQEAKNNDSKSVDITRYEKACKDINTRSRGGGYRVTIIIMGNYAAPSAHDELRIIDVRIQEEISRQVRMMFLEDESKKITGEHAKLIKTGNWQFADALPHVAMMTGVMNLFDRPQDNIADEEEPKKKKKKGGGSQRSLQQKHLANRFLEILNELPQKNIMHDVAIGLALPTAVMRNDQIEIHKHDQTITEFQKMLSSVFEKFDYISLSALHEREDATSEIKTAMPVMKGYGDRLNISSFKFHRELARQANMAMK